MTAVQEPKKAPSAFFVFITAKRPELIKEVGATARAGSLAKLAAAKWTALSDDQKKPFVEKAAALKATYKEDLAKFEKAGGQVGQKRKARAEYKKAKTEKAKKKKSNADRPKRPACGAYGCFLAEQRSEIMKIVPAGSPCTMIGKIAGEQWQKLPDSTKASYQKLYETKKVKYELEIKAWKEAKAAAGEEAGDEDEGEDKCEEDDGDDEEATPKNAKRMQKRKLHEEATPEKVSMKAPVKWNLQYPWLDATVADDAKKLGYTLKLKTLMEKPQVKDMSAAKVLACLKAANGSVITTKKIYLRLAREEKRPFLVRSLGS